MRLRSVLAGLVATVGLAASAQGTVYYWDTATDAGLQAGNGTWSSDSATYQYWIDNNSPPDGTPLLGWPNTADYVANFSASGTSQVTVAGTVVLDSIVFDGAGYTLVKDPGGGTLNMTYITANQSATVNADVALQDKSVWTVAGGQTLAVGGAVDTVAAARLLQVTGDGNATITGVISGAGYLTRGGTGAASGSGTLTLSSSNSYTGVTTITSGVLSVAKLDLGGNPSGIGAATASGSNLVLDGGTLRYTGGGDTSDRLFTLTDNGGTIEAAGSGALVLSGTDAISHTGSLAHTLTLAGSNTGNNTLAAVVTDPAGQTTSLRKSGPGLWVLTGANTFTGPTTVNAGTLRLAHQNALMNSTLTTAGIEFDSSVSGHAFTLGGLSGASDLTLADNGGNPVALSVGNNNTNTSYSGALGGSGSLTKIGTGNLTLQGNNSYTGTTAINVGVVTIGHANALGDVATGTTVAGGAALQIQGGITTAAEPLTLSGSGIAGTGALRNVSGDNTFAGLVTLGAATRINSDANTLTLNNTGAITGGYDLAVGGAGNTTIASAIATGAGGLAKDGTGTVTLLGNNSYSGATSVNGGVLNIRHANALGDVATGTTVAGGAALQIQGGIATAAEPLTLSGSGIAGTGALRNVSGDNTFAGLVTLGAATRINSDTGTLTLSNTGTITGAYDLAVGGAGNTTIAGAIATGAFGLTKDGAGILTLTGSNGYSGATNVSAGLLRAADGMGLPGGSPLVLSGNGILETSGTITRTTGTGPQQFRITGGTAGFSARGGQLVINPGGAGGLLSWGGSDFNPSVLLLGAPTADQNLTVLGELNFGNANRTIDVEAQTATLSGPLSITGGSAKLTKVGPGKLAISSTSTLWPALTVSAGTLEANPLTATTTGGITVGAAGSVPGVFVLSAGSLTVTGNLVIGPNGGGNGNSPAGHQATISGGILNFPNGGANIYVAGGGNNDTIGTLNVSGSTTQVLMLAGASPHFDLGSGTNTTGYLNMSGGYITSQYLDWANGGTAVAYQTGGTIVPWGQYNLGKAGTGTATHTITGGILNGGSIALQVCGGGGGTGANATLNVLGGNVVTTGAINVGGSGVAAGKTGILNIAGGVASPGNVAAATPAGVNGVINLAGGLLSVNTTVLGGAGTSTINVSGGTLQYRSGSASWLGSFTNAYVFPGGLNVDTLSFTGTMAQSFQGAGGSGLTAVTLNGSGGAGYVTAPTVSFVGGTGTDAQAVATFNQASGQVTGITIVNPGQYSTLPTTVILSGGGFTTSASATITGTALNSGGGVTKLGTGLLTLTGTSFFTGPTTLTGGTLALGAASGLTNRLYNGLATPGNLVAAGGNLQLTGTNVSQSFSALDLRPGASGVFGSAGSGTAQVTFAAAGSGNYTRTVPGGVANLVSGASNFTVSFAQAPATSAVVGSGGNDPILVGATLNTNDLVKAQSGTVAAPAYTTQNAAGSWAAGQNITTNAALTGSATTLSINALRLNAAAASTLTIGGTDTLTLASGMIMVTTTVGNNLSTISGGSLTSGNGQDLIVVQNNTNASGQLQVNSAITGAIGLTKAGAGLLTLASTADAYSGPTTVSAGTLAVANDLNLGSGTAVGLFGGATLRATADGFSSAKAFTVAGAGAATVEVAAGTATLSGAIGTGLGAPVFTKTGTGALRLGSAAAAGLNGVPLTVTAGAVDINGYSSSPAALTLGGGPAGTSAVFGTGAGTLALVSDVTYLSTNNPLAATIGGSKLDMGSYTRTFTVNDSTAATDDLVVSASISGAGGAGLTKVGAGTLYLSGSNAYAGFTTVTAGALHAADGTGLPTASNLSFNGGVLETSGTFARTIGFGGNQVQWFGAGGFSANGGPLLVLLGGGTGTISWSGATAAGGLNGQTLIFGSTSANDVVTVPNNLNMLANRTITVNDNTNSPNDYAVLSGVIADGDATARGLTKNGTGKLVLSATNTYTGDTTISGGTLQVSSGANLGAGTGSTAGYPIVLNTATLSLITSAGADVGKGIRIPTNSQGTILLGGSGGAGTMITIPRLSIEGGNGGTRVFFTGTDGYSVNVGPVTGQGQAYYWNHSNGNVTFDSLVKTASGNPAMYMGSAAGTTLSITNGISDGKDWTLTMDGNSSRGGFGNETGTVIIGGTSNYSGGTGLSLGTLRLNGPNSGTGTTTVSGSGVLQIGNDNPLTSGALNLNAGATIMAYGGPHSLSNSTTWGGALTIGGSQSLTFTGTTTTGGQAVTIVNTGTTTLGTVTYNGNSTFNFANGSGNMVMSGDVTLSGADRTFTISPTGAAGGLVINGVVKDDGTARALTKAGAGFMALNGSNTYTGVTTITAGVLSVNNLAIGGAASSVGQSSNAAGNLKLNGGTLQYTGSSATTDRNFTVTSGSGAVFDITQAGTTLTFSNVTTSAFGGTSSWLTKLGPGTLELDRAGGGFQSQLSYIAVSAGTLTSSAPAIQFNCVRQTASGPAVTLGDSATLGTVLSFDSSGTANGAQTLQFTGTANPGVMTRQVILATAANSTNTLTVDVSDTPAAVDLELSGAINPFASSGTSTGNIIKTGAGTLYFSNANNSYTGTNTVTNGTLRVAALALGGSNSSIGASSSAANNLVLNGGALQYVGGTVATDRLFTVGSSGGTLDASGSGPLTFNNTGAVVFSASTARTLTLAGSNTADNTLALAISDGTTATTQLAKNGAGTWVVSGLNTYSGGTTINAGVLTISASSNLGAAGNPLVFNGGTLRTTTAAIRGSWPVSVNSGGGTVEAQKPVTFLANLSGSGTLTKTGSDSLVLDGSNAAFTGPVTMNAGILLLDVPTALSAANRVTFTPSSTAKLLVSYTNNVTVGGLSSSSPLGTPVVQSDADDAAPAATLTVANSADNTFNGTIQNGRSDHVLALVKDGTATLTLGGSNSYGGGTSVLHGTLGIATADSLPTAGNLSIASGGHMVLASGLSHAISLGGLTITSGAGSGEAPVASGQWSVASGQPLAASPGGAPAPTPEPGTFALLMVAGLAALAVWRRKRFVI